MSIFTKRDEILLRRCGDQWTTETNGDPVCFYGIFDAEVVLVSDATGNIVSVSRSVLTTLTRIAKNFSTMQHLTDHTGVIWYVRESIPVNDGAMSQVHLVEHP